MSAVQATERLPARFPTQRDKGVSITLSKVSHRYASDRGNIQTLSELDLLIAPRSFLSLVGQSGCGKSTLLNILSGLISPTSGTVSFRSDGAAANDTGRPTVSYLTQEDRLLPWRSVVRNLELPLELRGVGKKERQAIALRLLDRVGLSKFANASPATLSGGMRQRVSIARALSLRPSVLLLDEPFGSLDAWTKKTLHQLLLDLHHEQEATTILVTHDVFEAIALSSRIVTLAPRPGRLIESYDLAPVTTPRAEDELYSPALFNINHSIRSDLGLVD